jgi:hypothetical protein
MNYLIISDYMWYIGHILSGLSIIFTRDNYYLSVSIVFWDNLLQLYPDQ